MFRYVSFVWNDLDPAARAAAGRLAAKLGPEWQAALREDGLWVFHTGTRAGANEAYLLQDGAGVALGRLFKSGGPGGNSSRAPATFDARESSAILMSGGRHLFEKYWGRYVVFLRDKQNDATLVLRDPTAGIPCLTMSVDNVDVYVSLAEDAASLAPRPLTINWDYIKAHLCYQRLEYEGTGLNEITQLVCGECIELRRGKKSRRFVWNPFDVARTDPLEDPVHATEVLRETAKDVIRTWASCHDSLVLTLSGGLDSTIVLTCLKDMPNRPRITCVNYFSEGSDENERVFARISAGLAGCELLERERDRSLSFEPLRTIPRGPTPVNYRYFLENSRKEGELATELNATALFSGEGGDQMFYQARAMFTGGDYLVRHGLLSLFTPAMFLAALDGARVDRLSVWRVLREALKQVPMGKRWNMQEDAARFKALIPEEIVSETRENIQFLHPMFRSTDGLTPSGKLWHAYQLVFPMDFYDPIGLPNGVERVPSLLSQPLIEVCLRIPTWTLVSGGWDRAIARRAFQHEAPREIIMRRTKGGVDEYTRMVLQSNAPYVREMVLDGFLVRQKLIDRAKLEDILSGRPTRINTGPVELYDCVGVESWLRRWITL